MTNRSTCSGRRTRGEELRPGERESISRQLDGLHEAIERLDERMDALDRE
ncbi:hypothetical protein [Halorarum salinum]|uniref:Uncharacterized protein n=1 Tax=Halorarum salinum TaxID=2743089 RepID=A0A7D5Q8Q8_9EURY|nr:hypothetical protein [Halobaculum salinum]QLG61137.1 hypothetical protein HUG12_05065 [Halobaculum salinum]